MYGLLLTMVTKGMVPAAAGCVSCMSWHSVSLFTRKVAFARYAGASLKYMAMMSAAVTVPAVLTFALL